MRRLAFWILLSMPSLALADQDGDGVSDIDGDCDDTNNTITRANFNMQNVQLFFFDITHNDLMKMKFLNTFNDDNKTKIEKLKTNFAKNKFQIFENF